MPIAWAVPNSMISPSFAHVSYLAQNCSPVCVILPSCCMGREGSRR